MALSFAHKASRVPASVAAHPAAGSGRVAFARVLGTGLDAAVARAEPSPSGRALHWALGADLAQPAAQAAAHREAVVYGRHRAGLFGAALPLLSALRLRMARKAPDGEAHGRAPDPDRLAALAAPLLRLIARQFCRIDARVVVPQEKVDLMNRIDPGTGDALRRQVEQAQAEIGDVHSAASLRLHQATFDALAAEPPAGAGAPAALELPQLASAALGIGAAMVLRHSAATVAVADARALRLRAAGAGSATAPGAAALAGLSAEPVPLFYALQASAAPGLLPGGAGTAGPRVTVADLSQRERLGGTLAAVQQDTQALAGVARALRRPLARMGGARPVSRPGPEACVPVLTTLSDVVAIGLHSEEPPGHGMAAVPRPTALCGPGTRARVAEGPARRAILAMGHAVGMHAAVKPLFPPFQGPGESFVTGPLFQPSGSAPGFSPTRPVGPR